MPPPAPPWPAPAAALPARWRRRGGLVALVVACAWLHWQLLSPGRQHLQAGAEAAASAPPQPAAMTVSAAPPRTPSAALPATRPSQPRPVAAPPRPDVMGTAVAPEPVSPATEAEAPPPTQIPPSQVLRFTAEQGAQRGNATLDWRHDGSQYALTLDGPGWLALRSQGRLDAWGLAPVRHTEHRPPRSQRALTMERPDDGTPGRVAYSSRTTAGPLPPGLQDRLSWLVQLPARVAAEPQASGWTLQVASAGGDQQRWHLQRLPLDAGEPDVIHLRHAPLRPYDNAVEVWLDAAPPHAPRRIELGAARGDSLVLTRRGDGVQSPSTSDAPAPK